MEEVKIGCILGMLQCLDRPHRLAYILGEILRSHPPFSVSGDAVASIRKLIGIGDARR